MKKMLTMMVAAAVLASSGPGWAAAELRLKSAQAQQAHAQLTGVLQQVQAAVDRAAGNPWALVDHLPLEVVQGNEEAYNAILSLQSTQGLAPLDLDRQLAPVREVFRRQSRELAARYAPAVDPRTLERQALQALSLNRSDLFQGHFLHPLLPPPYGRFKPNCENHWCMPDLYISDYDDRDLDGRPGNYCSLVPDFWFRWPCYQHDIAYAFAPMVADSKIGSFLAINWQWYADMRTECHERIRFDWLNPEFILCQVVAFTYYVAVNTFAFPIFNTPNEIKGYDVLEGDEPNLAHPPVYRRWNACTGRYTASSPFVSYERRVLNGFAAVPQGGVLELSGRTHRGTRILFEFVDSSGNTVANHLTGKAADNCIIAQEPERFSTAVLPVGTYTIKAWLYAWEGSGYQIDWAYDPPRIVAYGAPRHLENVLTLAITAPYYPGGGGEEDPEGPEEL